jgi:deoxyribose-phosphate aldolase
MTNGQHPHGGARSQTRSLSAADRRAAATRAIALLDLTDLNDEHSAAGLDELVRRAVVHGTAAVCVWPEFVSQAAAQLQTFAVAAHDRPLVRIATVVNFPSGDATIAEVRSETEAALADGADEIDLVLPYRAVLTGDADAARSMVKAIAEVVHASGSHLKVILETGELIDGDLIRAASRLAIESGADFIKSSTGKTATSATLDAVSAMVDVIVETGGTVGLKPSGGIRTVEDAVGYLDLVDRALGSTWATPNTLRFGASGLLDDALTTS